MVPAVFLDRDGTINVERNYLYKISEFEFEYQAISAISLLNQAGYKVIVITNQAGIGRGYYHESDVEQLHSWMNQELQKYGAHIDGFYYCPHHPDGIGVYQKRCACRKPGIALIEQAVNDFNIDIETSFFIGDRETDMVAGEKAGLRSILVLTGYGKKAQVLLKGDQTCARNIYEAVTEHVLKR
ncbi:MAG: D-glycero-beta-D-manno-heptose 1,7-bisphosphate 7-phosphatase [Sporomusaceae bacterium]|nr:D-glycero-beta-D-manno-heptose 1,7-bisphosphate 7-phosphatase [Sporomusaceae bacterium]